MDQRGGLERRRMSRDVCWISSQKSCVIIHCASSLFTVSLQLLFKLVQLNKAWSGAAGGVKAGAEY